MLNSTNIITKVKHPKTEKKFLKNYYNEVHIRDSFYYKLKRERYYANLESFYI